MDSKVLNDILSICIPIATALLAPIMVALFRHYWAEADRALSEKAGTQWSLVKSMAVEAVRYAEQVGLVKEGEDLGKAKLALAVSFVENTLKARGVDIDLFPIVDMIEAAVMEEFGKDKAFFLATEKPQSVSDSKVV